MPPERPSSGDFGAKLRAARERKGVSLRQIATATKISIAALEALERNDISRLPGGIFRRAFVRSYASEVGLDPEATIQDFIAQFPQDTVTAGHPTSDQVFDNETFESDRRISTTFLGLLVICVPLAGAVVYFSTAGRRASSPTAVTAVTPPPAPAPSVSPSAQPETPVAAQPAAVPSNRQCRRQLRRRARGKLHRRSVRQAAVLGVGDGRRPHRHRTVAGARRSP
jgi:cytoskeleton protein RodZ